MPHTIRNKYDKLLSYESLMQAHKKSQKCKSARLEVIRFNLLAEDYINWLYLKLKNGTYKHGNYTTFYITDPKPRKVEKARYLDRIVHRWLVDNFLQPYFEPTFITTTYACIRGRGMHKACVDMQKTMKHLKRTWGDYYIIKMDVAKYFESINKKILYEILAKKIKDPKVLWLTKSILVSSMKQKCSEKENLHGIPIGNYTSQIFANIYLNELDQFVKKELKVKHYSRYMDDFIICTKTKSEANILLNQIIKFLQLNLELKLNRKTQIFKSKQGVNYCGYKINENRMKIRDKGKRRLKKKVAKLTKQIEEGTIGTKDAVKYLSGHLGYIQKADVFNLKNKLFYVV